ncbi:hypothetical protein [Acinetobacter faecalis]|uniref:hypothetical protein n=1 Tax=Acinetobacter faecalis TaxID=2665161 RepID=UPI002A915915|nr:hypothetical protein [Acinetobacter faecalis]MDY6455970.1 hypothetical protein [Acinetobacter faecalis]
MKIKDLSITEITTVITGIGLTINVIAQTYFYIRIDALWIMSIISPSIYILDVFKIIILFLILFGIFLSFETLYRQVTKKFRLKTKILYSAELKENIENILIENRKKYERIFKIIVFLIIWLICYLFTDLELKTTYRFLCITGLCIGIFLILTLDKTLTKNFKRSLLGVLLVLGAIGLGELKFIQIDKLPIVILKDQKSDFQKSQLLEISKTEAILLKQDKKGSNSFKIITSNQIDKIINE